MCIMVKFYFYLLFSAAGGRGGGGPLALHVARKRKIYEVLARMKSPSGRRWGAEDEDVAVQTIQRLRFQWQRCGLRPQLILTATAPIPMATKIAADMLPIEWACKFLKTITAIPLFLILLFLLLILFVCDVGADQRTLLNSIIKESR